MKLSSCSSGVEGAKDGTRWSEAKDIDVLLQASIKFKSVQWYGSPLISSLFDMPFVEIGFAKVIIAHTVRLWT